jgi:hypothetical protein
MTAHELLTELGFERLGPDAKHADVTLWLRTGGGSDILLQMTREDTHASDAARLIYEAGLRDKRDEIAGRWKAFTDAMRQPAVSDLWTNARELQAARQAEIVAAASMPKT